MTTTSDQHAELLLDDSKVSYFQENGFVLGGRLLSDQEAMTANNIITDIIENPENQYHSRVYDFQHGGRPFLHIKNMWKRYEVFRDLHRNPHILHALCQLTGGETKFHLWQDRFFYKPKSSGSFHTWHQDSTYLPFIRPYVALSAWIALTDATVDNGAMRMVPGSHTWPDATEIMTDVAEYAADGRALPESFDGHQVHEVDCPVPRGYVHFHHGSTWHCSLPNWAEVPRCAIGMFFVVHGARFDGTSRWAKDYDGAHNDLISPDYYPLVEVPL
jgi:ectoine hydroxylase-related dioxygenase (phytanoyl-CoA dioxygenase family)